MQIGNSGQTPRTLHGSSCWQNAMVLAKRSLVGFMPCATRRVRMLVYVRLWREPRSQLEFQGENHTCSREIWKSSMTPFIMPTQTENVSPQHLLLTCVLVRLPTISAVHKKWRDGYRFSSKLYNLSKHSRPGHAHAWTFSGLFIIKADDRKESIVLMTVTDETILQKLCYLVTRYCLIISLLEQAHTQLLLFLLCSVTLSMFLGPCAFFRPWSSKFGSSYYTRYVF